jgi:flagellar biosynthesis GTPase FlhF
MKTRALKWLFLVPFIFTFVLAVAKPAVADDDDDPPSRVARLSYANGQVSFSPAGTDDWVAAVLNRPITTGDKLWTDQGARAELHVGSAAIRLSGQTGFSFLNLDDRIMQIRVTEGTINLRVLRLEDQESIEVDTPNLAFTVLRPGRYRINVNEAGDTTVINVPEGTGEVTGGGSAYTIHPGDQGVFTGIESLNADMQYADRDDDFDRWCSQRDYREEHAVARRYVSDDVVGYEDLDDYGGWRQVPEYGTVWFPHVTVVDWAPYRYGHWAWVSPWGWTWVDDAPWGFAPFHYGRWVNVRGAWGWIPCPPRTVAVAYVRPVYAPALVAWVGGPHFAVGVGVGGGVGVNVGWFPLGPREVYVPSYHSSRTYINNVNVSNTTVNQTVVNNYYNTTVINKNVTNVTYVNQRVAGGVTATSGQNFSSAQPVGRNMVRVNEREVATAQVAVSAPAVVPPKQAVLGGGAAVRYQPPAAVQARAVVAKTPPPPAPLPFQQRQAAIRANEGQPISNAQVRQLQSEQPHNNVMPVRMAPPARTATAPQPGNVQQGNAQPGNAQYGNRGMQPNNNRPPSANVNPNANSPAYNNANPNTNPPVNNNRPANANVNPNVNAPVTNNANANPNAYNNRPPSARPTNNVNPQLEQKHQEQIQQLQQKQDQEYQKVQQKQYQQQQQQQQKLQQQNADAARQQQIQQQQQQLQQKQQQQLQQIEQKHDQQQQQLQQKQAAEHARQAPPPPQNNKPAKNEDKSKDKDKDKDKPPHR